MKKLKSLKKLFLYVIFFLFTFYVGHTLAKTYDYAEASIFIDKVNWILDNPLKYRFIDFTPTKISLYVGFLTTLASVILYLRLKKSNKKYRFGVEHGSAKFLTIEELKKFEDEIEDNNIIFTENGKMGLYNKRLPYDKQLNKNVLGVGGSGSGKTRYFLKPNAMQLNGSKIFTDTKGLLVHELGNLYEQKGYKVKVIDLIDFTNSNQFNVFKYIRKETDIDKVAEAIVNSTSKSDNKGEDFWLRAELMLMKALIGYLYFEQIETKKLSNLSDVTELIRYIDSKDPEEKSPLEMLLEEQNKRLPNNYAYRQFQNFNLNFKGETRESAKAVISARFEVFEHEEVRKLLEVDNLDIDTWNLEKTAVFINIPEVNDAYQFISALLFSTIFEETIKTADKVIKGEIEKELIHLEIYADELAQIGKINNLSKYLAVIRSREISFKPILQSLSQLDLVYGKEEAKIIINNCDTILYLGTNDKETLEYLSFRAGNETIDDKNYSENRGKQGGSTLQHSKIKRELVTAHEIATIDINEALVYISKQNVFKDKKANPNNHKNAHYLANSPDDKTWYIYDRYMDDVQKFISNTKEEHIVELTKEDTEKINNLGSPF